MSDDRTDTRNPNDSPASPSEALPVTRPQVAPLSRVDLSGLPRPASRGPIAAPSGARRRLLQALIAALLIAGIGAAAWTTWGRPLDVTPIKPVRGDAIEAVYATGMIEAVDNARVGTTVPSRIVSLAVDEGDVVRQGQIMAQLDDRTARQRLADAEARLVLAQQEYARDQALAARGDRSLQALQRSQRERDGAAAIVEMLRRDLAEYVIAAPLDGIVMKRLVQPGETIGANAGLFEVASTAHLRVAADVDERDIAQIRQGAPVAVRAEAFPDQAFRAAVTRIRLQGDPSTRTYRVEADLPQGTKLFIGMTVDVNIQVAVRHDALLLPATALRHGAAQGGRPGPPYVFVAQDGKAHRVPVQAGATSADTVEIRDGLDDSARVIADPPAGLTDGRRIRVRP
jgi:RND family efflux transporter MFP subunit